MRELLSSSGTTTCATSGATFRSTTCTPARSSPPKPPRRPRRRAGSGSIYDALFAHQDTFSPQDLVRYAAGARPRPRALPGRPPPSRETPRVAEDVASADASGVSGTPTFFINGRRHHGAYDIDTLTAARARGAAPRGPGGGLSAAIATPRAQAQARTRPRAGLPGAARPGAGGRRARLDRGQPPDLPQPGVVASIEPALAVAAAELDQLLDELAREEQVAEQLAVDGAALGAHDPPEQREVGVAQQAAECRRSGACTRRGPGARSRGDRPGAMKM